MDADEMAKTFVKQYYSAYDDDRSNLGVFYREASMLTLEGQKIQGPVNIVAKLTSLPFQKCKHGITTIHCQSSGPAGGTLVFVDGLLEVDGQEYAPMFIQVLPLPPSS